MEDRFRESYFKIFRRVECRDGIPTSISEGMEAPEPQPWVELRGTKAAVVTAEERTVLLPSEEERVQRIWGGRIGNSRRQAQQPLVLLLV